MARPYPKTEAQKAQAREYAKRKYWEDPERSRADSSEYGKRRRAADKAAGITPKPRVRSDAVKANQRDAMRARYWTDPERFRALVSDYNKRRRQEDPDAVRAAKRAQYQKNHERILAQQRAYRAQNRDRIRAAARARILPEENRARVKAWRRANRDKVREIKLRRRAREAGAPVNDFTANQWQELLDEFNGECAYCHSPAATQDHLTPLSRGGAHTALNIVPACLRCNSRKGTRTLIEFLELGLLVHSWDGEAS